MAETLYSRLGGYDAIAAVSEALLQKLQADPQLGRFWKHRGKDGLRREKQLLIDFLCASAGGPLYYTGRDMKLSHEGMGISDSDCGRSPGMSKQRSTSSGFRARSEARCSPSSAAPRATSSK